jgi:phage baseplate assembly protein W
MTLIPKLAVPLRMGTSGLAVVEQGSGDEIAACVYAVVATPHGSRLEEPDFGVEDPLFSELPIEDVDGEWLEQIAAWEPRADIFTTQDIVDLTDRIRVEVAPR